MTWERFAADKAKADAVVERLRAEVAAMRPIVERMATMEPAYSHEAGNYCVFCHASDDDPPYDEVHHTTDCPVTLAQTCVAAHPNS